MVANNALPQYGTYTSLLQVPLPFPWSLFSLCFLWFLSFQSLFHSHLPPSPPLIQLWVWGSVVSSPSGSGRSPAAKWNLVNSGPRNERFLTCQSGKLQCSLNSHICLWFSNSMNCSGQFTNAIFTNVSNTPIPTWFWSFQRRFPLLKN